MPLAHLDGRATRQVEFVYLLPPRQLTRTSLSAVIHYYSYSMSTSPFLLSFNSVASHVHKPLVPLRCIHGGNCEHVHSASEWCVQCAYKSLRYHPISCFQ